MNSTSLNTVFNATAVFIWKPDCRYRVYVTSREIFIIRFGGQDLGSVVWHYFGAVGAVIEALFKSRKENALLEKIKVMDEASPEDLLPQDKRNFKISAANIVESSLEPEKVFGGHGRHIGRWIICRSNGKKMVFELNSIEEMKTACEALPKLFGGLLKVNAQWDESQYRFVKKTDGSENGLG